MSGLTDKYLKGLKPDKFIKRIREKTSDPALKGFGVAVTPSGTKTFFLHYTSPETGARRYAALGVYPGVSLADARQKARELRAQLQEGTDPVEALEREKEARARAAREAAEIGTVKQLFECYTQDLKRQGKRSAEQVEQIYARDIGPAFGDLKARDVTADHCAELLSAILEGKLKTQKGRPRKPAPRMMDITRSYLQAAFEFGRNCKQDPRWRYNAPDFALTENPVSGIKPTGDGRSRNRYLPREELVKVWHTIAEPHEYQLRGRVAVAELDLLTVLAVRFMIATGQREEEVLHAEWTEFDEEQMLWAIPSARRGKTAKKTDQPHLVPLTEFHLSLLREVKAAAPFDSKYLFPAKNKEPRTSSTISQAIRRVCDRNGIERFQPRDLRRTWKTLAGAIRIDLELRNRIQGHALQDVGSKSYDRYAYLDEKREAMVQWSDWLEELVASTP